MTNFDNERFSVVHGRDNLPQLEAYLYSHTTCIFRARDKATDHSVVILCTSVEASNDVDYLADYQCERLQSGLYGVQGTYERLSEALTAMAEIVAYEHEKTTSNA